MRFDSREQSLQSCLSAASMSSWASHPRFPSTCMSKAVLTASLEHSTCPYQRRLLSFRMRSRYSMPSLASSSLDLVVTMSCSLTLQICLIIALSFHCRRWRFGFVNGQVLLSWSNVLHTQELLMQPPVLNERWWEERTASSSLSFFQVVFTRVVVESSQSPATESLLLGSKRKLVPPACQVHLDFPLWSAVQGCAVPWHCVHL